MARARLAETAIGDKRLTTLWQTKMTGRVTGEAQGVFPHRSGEGKMRSVGLAALLLSVLIFLFPWYDHWVPFMTISANDSRLLGGLLLAVGALTLAVYRR